MTPQSSQTDEDPGREVPDLDLSPRARRPQGRRRWLPAVVIVGLVAGLLFVATKALGDAAMFFYNADEAVAMQAELGDSRFRLQGKVQEGTIVDRGADVEFTVAYNDVAVDVVHQGDPPELFQDDMPVVLEGRWDAGGTVFSSDRMLVKHDETYETENDKRLRDAQRGGDDEAATS